MPRPLSDPEWLAFTNELPDVSILNLPPWGGVVQWEGMDVLIYECQARGTLCSEAGDVLLTDISDIRAQIEIAPEWEYNTAADLWVWHVPQETMQVIGQRLREVGEIIPQIPAISFNIGVLLLGIAALYVTFSFRRV